MSHTPKIPGILNGVTTIQSNVSTLQTDVSTLDSDISTLQTNVSTLQTQVDSITKYNISTRDTEANILASSPTNPTGEVTIAYGTDTQDLYVWNGTVWYKFTDDQLFSNTYSLSFDGTDDYVDTGSNFKSTLQSDFTVALWVKINSFTHGRALIAADSGFSYNHRFSVFQKVDGGNHLGSFYAAAGSGTSALYTSSTYDWASWNHVAYSYAQNGGSVDVKVYVNGALDNSNSTSGVTMADFSASGETAKTLFLGARHENNGSAQAFSSVYLDEVAFFSSALSGPQVASLVDTSGSNPVPANISSLNPVAWYRMGDDDGGTGTTITDQGSGGNNGTLTNGPTFSTTIPS